MTIVRMKAPRIPIPDQKLLPLGCATLRHYTSPPGFVG